MRNFFIFVSLFITVNLIAMTNNSYTDKRQALTQILGVLDAIADKKASGETVIARHNEQSPTGESDKSLDEWTKLLPDTVKYQYAKETFEDNLEEVGYKMKQANEVHGEQGKASDESLLDALQNKSSKDKKYKSQKDIESNYRFTNEKPKSPSFSEWCRENVDWIIIAFCILTILICIFG